MQRLLCLTVAHCLLVPAAALLAGGDSQSNVELTYERDIRPLLKAHCFHCHGEGEQLEGQLDLRLRRLIVKGGESGPALVPGQSDASLLYDRILRNEMPPEEVAIRLNDEEVERIRRWIDAGAHATRQEPESLGPGSYFTEEEKSFWSFQRIRRPELPHPKNADRVRTAIDQLLLAQLEAHQFTFSSEAGQSTLLRRAYFDLIGLPPSPDDVFAFVRDDGPDAFDRLIERLLASPHYGERWGRHWLDVAGYADSEGYTDDDPLRPDAWKYRDYVIRSLNADKPFDQFIQEQLAGDELIAWPETAHAWADGKFSGNSSQEFVDKLVATGFLRMAPDGTGASGVEPGVARNEVIAKTVEIVSTSLLGLTVACAQCHNHRYDPITQEDYYRFRAIFDPALDWKDWLVPSKRRISLYTNADRVRARQIDLEAKKIDDERIQRQEQFIEQTFQRELAKLPEQLREPVREARSTPEKNRTAAQKKLLKDHPSVNVTAGSLYLYDRKAADELEALADRATQLRATKPKEEFVRAVWEPEKKATPQSFVFYRGDHEQPQQEVLPAELSVLASSTAGQLPVKDSSLPTSGRRLAYAKWLTSGEHPLVPRVLVNQVWMRHFGRGLVTTPGDFGYLGARPSHPELLDWLADEFLRRSWSQKQLHRLIMTSTAYRQTSTIDPLKEAADAENQRYWRMPVRRLDAETIRDSTLCVSGQLNIKPFGPPVPVMADHVGQFVIGIENLNAGRPGATIPMRGEEYRRSVYVQVRRSRPLSVLETFDAPRMEPNCTARTSSTVAPQSLMLMNSQFVTTSAQDFARRVRQEAGDQIEAQLSLAWLMALARQPTRAERRQALQYLEAQKEHFAAIPLSNGGNNQSKSPERVEAQQEALTSLCHALLNSNEFLYVD